jgi:hypothetical protein
VIGGVIARTWRGWTKREDADAYSEHVEETGGRGDRTEFVTMSLW